MSTTKRIMGGDITHHQTRGRGQPTGIWQEIIYGKEEEESERTC
jgi:hypothetical protein